MRLYGEDFVIDETIWIGHVVDDDLNSTARAVRHACGCCTFKLRDGLIVEENVWFQFDKLSTEPA
jgi:hypothetical protein